ncbi:MAG TPA: hypothetical protein VG225_00900 [Terracidiphilus sp.]|jgi:hypothetical protein|nr:hypothetical protein [Terracidiphilus sp.]
MGKLNVKNGTPVGNERLCRRCTWGQCMTGYRESDFVVICTNANPNFKVPFPIMDCTSFDDRHRPTFKQMTALAIDVARTRVSMRTAGFNTVTRVQPIRRVAEDDDEDEGEAARIR